MAGNGGDFDFADATIGQVQRAFENAEEVRAPGLLTSADAVRMLRSRWTDSRASVSSGILGLDQTLGGGLRAGEMLGVAAPTGHGKTALLLQVLRNAALRGAQTIYLSAEIPEEEVAARLAALERYHQPTSVDAIAWRDILEGKAGDEETLKALDAVECLRDRFCLRELPDGATVDFVRDEAANRRAFAPGAPLVVCIDPLQRLFVGESGVRRGRVAEAINANETERVGAVALALKRIASDLRACVIFAADGTMDAAMNDGKGASTGFRGSYIISNAATTLFWLYVDENGASLEAKLNANGRRWARDVARIDMSVAAHRKVNGLGPAAAALDCRKNRAGPKQNIPLLFVPGGNLFLDGDTRIADVPGN